MNSDIQTAPHFSTLPPHIRCLVLDWGGTLSPDLYFNIAPPGYPEWRDVIQASIFNHEEIARPWMSGDLTMTDVARILQSEIPLDIPTMIHYMELGCHNLTVNPAVWDFTAAQRQRGMATVLITGNIELFDTVIVPEHRLTDLFDVIVNSHNHHTTDKKLLWPIAFSGVSESVGYHNSLLIEDNPSNVARFRALGGIAHQYTDDAAFLSWLRDCNWE